MGIFSKIYAKVLTWSQHKYAPYYLGGVSFIESSVFPIPPEIMLVSMGLAKPQQAWRYALIATVFSVLGGMLGYLLGDCFLHIIYPYIQYFGYEATYHVAATWFKEWGIWALILAGFIPIPYKIFTISAGAMHLVFWPFVLASAASRGIRFFLVAALMYVGGAKIQKMMHQYIDVVGWGMLGLLCLAYGSYYVIKLWHGSA